jgi:hypothetical protein
MKKKMCTCFLNERRSFLFYLVACILRSTLYTLHQKRLENHYQISTTFLFSDLIYHLFFVLIIGTQTENIEGHDIITTQVT